MKKFIVGFVLFLGSPNNGIVTFSEAFVTTIGSSVVVPSSSSSSSSSHLSKHHGRLISARSSSSSSSSEPTSSSTSSTSTSSSDNNMLVSFQNLGLSSETMAAIRSQPDWITPTPIQQLVIPKLALPQQQQQQSEQEEEEYTDETTTTVAAVAPSVWCEAPTGSGKTAAYVLPLLHNLLVLQQQQQQQQNQLSTTTTKKRTSTSSKGSGRVSSLILCPTRELAAQIGSVVSQLANNVSTKKKGSTKSNNNNGWNIVTIYGGLPLEPQISQLADCIQYQQTIDVLIATPGRLVDVLTYYSQEDSGNNGGGGGTTKAQDAALERRLLSAMGDSKDSTSLSLEQIQELQLDTILGSGNGGRNGGRSKKGTSQKGQGKSNKKISSYYDTDTDSSDGRSELIHILNNLQYFIVDEADRLLSRAFEKEVDNVIDLLPSKIPTWLFSATYPQHIEPRIDSIWQRINNNENNEKNYSGKKTKTKKPSTSSTITTPVLRLSCATSDRIRSSSSSSESNTAVSSTLAKKLERQQQRSSSSTTVVTSPEDELIGPASTIGLRTIRLERPARTQALRKLLEEHSNDWDRVLVFVATRYSAEHVSRKLRKVGISSAELHGKLDQDARQRRLLDLKRGKIRVLLATDVASRGLDIVGLPVVVNYDLPRSTADFVHRVGRTGRAGRSGTAISFCTPDSEAHLDLIEQRHLAEPIPREVLVGFEPNEERWEIQAESSRISPMGTQHSDLGLAHDRMFGGIKGRRKSKKDRLREEAAAAAASSSSAASKKQQEEE